MSSIQLENVSLDYILKTGSSSVKKALFYILKSFLKKDSFLEIENTVFRALNNINLSIQIGDRIGILGKNGAGKSTLLRVLGKIYKPMLGDIHIHGRVSNLFDINLGLDIEATGYENIVTLGIMRGLSKREAENLIEDVASFTELDHFLKMPVRTYSAGMQIKLVFAVATAGHPEILLIDEIIGTGDASFMLKATERLHHFIERSHILVLTSHSNDILRRFCQKIIVLDKGEIQFMGNTEEGISFYENHL